MEKNRKSVELIDGENSLHKRMEVVLHLLATNSQLTSQQPSQEQFQMLMDHCFTLYDQLDFITLEYTNSPAYYLHPKLLATHSHRALRTTKYLISNIRHWVQTHSLQIMHDIA
jgi:hypothetical protein